jgi:hypothetical protein
MALSNNECSAQTIKETWLPEKYVNSLLKKDINFIQYLSPIEGFESPFNNGYVLTYKGELNPINVKKIIHNGQIKYKLPAYFYSYFNLFENSKEFVDKLRTSTVFISKHQNRLLLEIIAKNSTEKIYFIDRVENYKFKNIRDSKRYLLQDTITHN